MTKSQIWVASFLAIFFILFVLVQVTKEDEDTSNTPSGNTVPQSNISSEDLNPAELITRLGCRGCHGSDLQGTRMGPKLTGLSEFWSRDELVNYLRNPNSYMDKDRFRKYKEEFPGILMPSFSNVDVKDLGKIADYLITL